MSHGFFFVMASGSDAMYWCGLFFLQAEDVIRELVRSRGLGDVYKRQRGDLRFAGAWESVGAHGTDLLRGRRSAGRGVPGERGGGPAGWGFLAVERLLPIHSLRRRRGVYLSTRGVRALLKTNTYDTVAIRSQI